VRNGADEAKVETVETVPTPRGPIPVIVHREDDRLMKVLTLLGGLMALFVVYTSWQQVQAQDRLANIVQRQAEIYQLQQKDIPQTREGICRQANTRAVQLAIADGLLTNAEREAKPEAYEKLRQAREEAAAFDRQFPAAC
jgi:hypothetical protein